MISVITCPRCKRKINKRPTQMGHNKTHRCPCGCVTTFEGNGARDVQRSLDEYKKMVKRFGR